MVPTRPGSLTMLRSTKSSAPSKLSINWCPTAIASVVLPTPPRSYDSHETCCAQPGGYLFDFDFAVDHRKTYRQIRMLKCGRISRSQTLSGRAREISATKE